MLYIVITGPVNQSGPDLYRVVATTTHQNIAQKYHELITSAEQQNGAPMVKSIIGDHRYQNNTRFVDIIKRELLAA